jgi:ubiquitin-like 1-activating enzyme E1 B
VCSSKVLVVGAGGIGCELIKNLSKSGYKDITLLDFDSIEITNLNRQFYFRKEHVGQSKAETVRDMLGKLDGSIKIEAINASIYDPRFNQLFYKDFTLVFSCLDNMKAREHLAAQATRNGKPLIDAGTMSYFGQAYSSIRFRNSCHNCNPTHSEQAPAFCTIRTHPLQPLHCATYARNFY